MSGWCEQRLGTELPGGWTLERLVIASEAIGIYTALGRDGRRAVVEVLGMPLAAWSGRFRFESDARALAAFTHPALETTRFDVTSDGYPFTVALRVEGHTLAARVAQAGRQPAREVLGWLDGLLDLLGAAHDAGLVHGDLRPGLVVLMPNGHLVVRGLGLRRQLPIDTQAPADAAALAEMANIAPERLRAEQLDGRADLFGLGAIAFFALSGQAPRASHDPTRPWIDMLLLSAAPSLAAVVPDVDPGVDRVIRHALELDRNARYPNARTMREDVRALQQGHEPSLPSQQAGSADGATLAYIPQDATRATAAGPQRAAWETVRPPIPLPDVSREVASRNELRRGGLVHGRYQIIGELGEGGMGQVLLARHVRTQRRVALKVLHIPASEGDQAFRRFEAEAQAAARIGSEHIVDVLDFGQLGDGTPFMVMELCEGESLSERLHREGPLQPRVAAELVGQMLEGLAPAHAAGIVHRDLKPGNIFLLAPQPGRPPDFVKILDFGISKVRAAGARAMTQAGSIMGTPAYMAPEQARGDEDVDHRVDIYSAGVILYRALSGRRPFSAPDDMAYLREVLLSEPTPLRTVVPHVDEGLAAVVHRAFARDRLDRFKDATEMAEALRPWREPEKPREIVAPTLTSVGPTSAPVTVAVAMPPPSKASRIFRWGCAGLLLLVGLYALVVGGVAVAIYYTFPVSKLKSEKIPETPEHTVVTVSDGTCVLSEMARAENYCVIPVVSDSKSAADSSQYRLLASYPCGDLDEAFGSDKVTAAQPVRCPLRGTWQHLDTADKTAIRKLRSRFPDMPKPTLVVTNFSYGHATVGSVITGIGLAFIIGAVFVLLSLRRKAAQAAPSGRSTPGDSPPVSSTLPAARG